jgi:hypothetical protein
VDRRTPTVAELVRRAVEICDPEDRDEALGQFERRFEDDDEPVTAVDDLDERLSAAVDGADPDVEPSVLVAQAVVQFLGEKRGHGDDVRDPDELIRLAARRRWHLDPPSGVADWLAARGDER